MGFFSQLDDDEAELLTGGVVNPSQAYGDGSNYGQYKKSVVGDLANPATVYGGTNYGQAKKA